MDVDLVVEVFREGRKYEQMGELKKAKNCYLDAATYAVELAKSAFGEDKERLRNIAQMLIDHARKMKAKIKGDIPPKVDYPEDENEVDLPLPPGSVQDTPSIVVPQEQHTLQDPFTINQVLILTSSGSPVMTFDYTADYLTDPESAFSTLNEVLLSGAITAIFSIMEEALHNKVRKIELEGEFLYVKDHDGLIFAALGEGDADALDEPILELLSNLRKDYTDRLDLALRTGQLVHIDSGIIELMTEFKENVLKIAHNLHS
ncbi:MAG: hypothetical protein D6732_22870 [Methanobacteriota archaeon]|nr:MAG: hypothetical protein D6732_22870 [Euryarchaeota archaeon]